MDVRKLFVLLDLDFVFVLIFFPQSSEGFWWWGSNEKKIDGKWSAWSSYSSCKIPVAEGSYAYRFRQRNCTNPAPKNGGKPCSGQSQRNAPCSDCDNPLGMESKNIKNSLLTASTFHEEFPPYEARLNGPSAWCAGDLSGEVYLQVDLQGLSLITAVATQGFYPDPKKLSLRLGSVSKYKVAFSDDGTHWEVHQNRFGNSSIFNGNGKADSNTVLSVLEPNIAARYIRIIPTARIYFACMKLELYGCRFKCGGYLPQAPGDLLVSSSETENIDCFWQIHLPKSTKINFDFINFDLPCNKGKVEIRGSASSYGRSKLLGHLCDYTSAPPSLVSNGNKMWIRFQSNSSDPMIGLYGKYFPNCDHQYNSTKGALTTPNFPNNYNHNSLCSWLVSVPMGKAIMLIFYDFDVEGDAENGPKCMTDYVVITEGDTTGTKLGHFCNTNRPPKYLCTVGNHMKILFKSDDVISLKGFNALYKAKEPNASCVEPSSTIITPSPTISVFSSTLAPLNSSLPAVIEISPTSSLLVSSTIVTNSSFGILVPESRNTNVIGQREGGEDDDEDDSGLTTIIIISVFSFIVFLMVIASVIPSIIHGYEKRKREREWLAAAEKNCRENGYEMQPIKPSINVVKESEPNETTAFLDAEDVTSNKPLYPPAVLKESNEEVDDSISTDHGCELEYDPTDLNLNVSQDLGSSFATEMAIIMNKLNPGKSQLKHGNDSLDRTLADDVTFLNDNENITSQNKESKDNKDKLNEESKESEEFDIDGAQVVAGIEEKNDKLQKALSDLKATLSQVHSDSGSIPDIQNLDTNSTVSVSGSQDIDNIPTVNIMCPT